MTKKQIAYKKSLLKMVHVSHTYRVFFANNREGWEEFLTKRFGVKSSKDLSIDELKSLVDYLNNVSDKLEVKKITKNQINFLLNLWAQRSELKSRESLVAFAKRIVKREFKELESLSFREANKLIAAIKALAPKRAKSANNPHWEGA